MIPLTQNAISYIRIELVQPNLSTDYEMAFFDRCGTKILVVSVAIEWLCNMATITIQVPCIDIGWYNAILVDITNGTETDVGAVFISQRKKNSYCLC